MRHSSRLALALTLATAVRLTLAAQAHTPIVPVDPPITFSYRDADGAGRLTVQDMGADPATGGRQIQVSLLQNGVRYNGSGITFQLEPTMPFTTLITFTLVSPRGTSYFFRGKTTSGITLSGQGTFNRAGTTQNPSAWSIVLGG
jgi:hypothetical protein